MATHRFTLLRKRVSFDHLLKVFLCNIFLKEKLKWWRYWSEHQEQTSLSRTMLEKQRSSSPGIVSTDQILQHWQQINTKNNWYVQGWQPHICISFVPWHHGAASSWEFVLEGVNEEHADGSEGSQDQRARVSGNLTFFLLISGFRCVSMRWHLRSRSSTVSTATLCVDHADLTYRYN